MLAKIDLLRSKILKESLKFPFFRSLFLSRSERILVLFFAASLFYLLVCSFFPLWVLLIGPILWGVPHLVSSLRYTALSFNEKSRKKLFNFQFSLWILVFVYRLTVDIWQYPLLLSGYPLLFESLCLILSFLYQIYLYRRVNIKILTSTVLFSILITCTYFYPIQTALFALIGHNYLPLIPWYQSCQDKKDRKVFFIASISYISLSLMIYFGVLDIVYKFIAPSGSIDFLNWDYSEVISPFVTGEFDYQFWFHIVVLYAFSQAIHYFIWMKAIPENHQVKQHPPSFQWSLNKLSSDFGSSTLMLLFTVAGGSILMWFFFEYQTARLVYFALASYHGFMEISTIPFLKSNLKSDRKDNLK